MRFRTVFFGTVVVLAALCAPAFAHGDLQSTDPERGATVDEPPHAIGIAFTEAPTDDGRFEVSDGCRDQVLAAVDRRGNDVELQVDEGQPGGWKVTYRVISAVDGHATKGSFSFKVRGAKDCGGSGGPDPAPTGDDVAQPPPPLEEGSEGSFPIVPVLVGAGLVVAAIVVRLVASRSE